MVDSNVLLIMENELDQVRHSPHSQSIKPDWKLSYWSGSYTLYQAPPAQEAWAHT